MSEAKHTPGPWKAIEWTCHAPTTVVTKLGSVKPVVIAECSGHGRDASESLADARLIAAAPELLEALEAIVESANDGRTIPEWLDERLVSVEAAIRKAKGE